jgi:hypothetical protein
MKIGVSIDNVLRDYFGQIENTFQKYFAGEDDEPIEIKDYDLEKWIVFPEEEIKQAELEFNPNFNEDVFFEDESETILNSVKTKVTLQEFMYEKCTLEIFGYANEVVSSAVETLNNLILENPQHEFIIITREGGLMIPSTLFFLSKTRCTCPNIKFVTEYSKVWDYVDVMITDHPEILNSKPLEKISVVVDKDYNQQINQSGLRIKTIKEIDSNVLQNIENILQEGNTDWVL